MQSKVAVVCLLTFSILTLNFRVKHGQTKHPSCKKIREQTDRLCLMIEFALKVSLQAFELELKTSELFICLTDEKFAVLFEVKKE